MPLEKRQYEPESTLVRLASEADASPVQASDGGSLRRRAQPRLRLMKLMSKLPRSCEADDPLCQYVPITIHKPLKTGCGLRGRHFGRLAPKIGVGAA